MKWNRIHSIENLVTTSYDSFHDVLESGLIIYYNENSELNILATSNFKYKYELLEANSTYYYSVNGVILFTFGNKIRRLNKDDSIFEMYCSTEEESIRVLSLDFCYGSTYKRNPRIRRSEIISTIDNKITYKWTDDKVLVLWTLETHLFHTQFKGDLFSLNTKNDNVLWKISLDNGISGRRYMQILDEHYLVVRKKVGVKYNNLLKLNLRNGVTIWEVENSLSHYEYDKTNRMFYGLQANIFEAIDAHNGELKLRYELQEYLHIPSHLNFYLDGYLYFSGYKNGKTSVFGAVNVDDGELVFTQEVMMPGEKSFRKGLGQPVVVDNRLYIRDAMKTLHVYEK